MCRDTCASMHSTRRFATATLQAVVRPGVDGIVLPKLESAAHLVAVDWVVTQLERERGLDEGVIDIMPIIETGRGVDALDEITFIDSRIKRLAFGAGDYTLDMGMRWTRAERELDQARARIVLASRVADLEPPIDTVFIHLGEIDNLEASARLGLEMGFQGRMCIHPEQVGPVNAIFTPSDEEIAKARTYVEAFKAAEESGSASIQVDGYFIDYPIVEKARRVLAIAEELGK